MRERPRFLDIIDFEGHVWRHELRLDGTEIYAVNLGLWMLVGEINRPDAGSGADVEDAVELLLWRDGRREEFAGESETEEVVLEV